MFIAITALVIPAIVHIGPHPVTTAGLSNLSLLASIVLIGAYGASLLFSFKTHAHLFVTAGGHSEKAEWSKARSVGILGTATIMV